MTREETEDKLIHERNELIKLINITKQRVDDINDELTELRV